MPFSLFVFLVFMQLRYTTIYAMEDYREVMVQSIYGNGRSWVEISKEVILNNCINYKKNLPAGVDIMAVVKADAYGHGDGVISKFLSDNGIRHFAVSNIDEAIHIREVGVKGQILILGYTPVGRADDLVKYDITQTLLSEEYASELLSIERDIKCHFAIDTGMRRIGLNADDLDSCEQTIRKYAKNLTGLFTHLCVADLPEHNIFTEKQIKQFTEVCKRVEDLSIPYLHYMNSAGGLWHKSTFSSFARLGIILYGLKPDYKNTLPDGIKPALSWKSVVSMTKKVFPGDTVGYGRTFTVEQPMLIATIPTGYADGYNRLLSGKGWVLIKGKRAPIVGRICMDQMMVDVTDIPNVVMGTEVVLLGNSEKETITADDLAFLYGSIGYEFVCGISKRVERVYVDEKPIESTDEI